MHGIDEKESSLLPTPLSPDSHRRDSKSERQRNTPCLDTFVKVVGKPQKNWRRLFPTPTKSDFNQRRPTENWKGNDLVSKVSILETNGQVCGQLNPTWVEWLMGFPYNWTKVDEHDKTNCNKKKNSKNILDETMREVSKRTWKNKCNEKRGLWAKEPKIPRVTKSVKNRVDRIKCLGNAVVPQVAEIFAKAIKEKMR